MKILVTQLARLGDIYLTWPTLNALLRTYGDDVEIHLLVRERYLGACEGLDPRVHVHALPSQHILEPIYSDAQRTELSLERFDEFITPILNRQFERVINLSFSPFSSFLTHLFEREGAVVDGYTRHTDGFFHIPDDGSAYFFAQVGIGRFNRYHLVDLFAHIAKVSILPIDFSWQSDEISQPLPSNYLCIHVGASEEAKKIPLDLQLNMIDHFCLEKNLNVVLIGSEGEGAELKSRLKNREYGSRLYDLVGKTGVHEASQILAGAFLIVGPDSFSMHIGSLSSTPCINLSCDQVNFWETGPVGIQSRVIYRQKMAEHDIDDVIEAFDEILLYCTSTRFIKPYQADEGSPRYSFDEDPKNDFGWCLVQAIYLGNPFPVLDDFAAFRVLQALAKVTEVAQETMPDVMNPSTRKRASDLLAEIETTIADLQNKSELLQPIFDWFQTEKIRMGPMPLEDLMTKTERVFDGLHAICSHYVKPEHREPEKSL